MACEAINCSTSCRRSTVRLIVMSITNGIFWLNFLDIKAIPDQKESVKLSLVLQLLLPRAETRHQLIVVTMTFQLFLACYLPSYSSLR